MLSAAQAEAAFRRPTKRFENALASGAENLRLLRLPGAVPIEGGLPLVRDGAIIGVSGVTSAQDGIIAAAGAAVLP